MNLTEYTTSPVQQSKAGTPTKTTVPPTAPAANRSRGYCTVLACILNGEKRAVKIPLANCSDPEGAIADLTNEIRILRRLRHPHLCSVHAAGGWRKEGEVPFLVLERLQYKNLSQQVCCVCVCACACACVALSFLDFIVPAGRMCVRVCACARVWP